MALIELFMARAREVMAIGELVMTHAVIHGNVRVIHGSSA
jgi:hypothetical protein